MFCRRLCHLGASQITPRQDFDALLPPRQAISSHHQIVIWICFWFCIKKKSESTETAMLSTFRRFLTALFSLYYLLPSVWNFTLVYAVTLNTGHQSPLVGSFFTSSFPQFWNPLWPWLQRYLPDGDVNTHFQILAEPLLAGFWQRCFYNITYYQV